MLPRRSLCRHRRLPHLAQLFLACVLSTSDDVRQSRSYDVLATTYIVRPLRVQQLLCLRFLRLEVRMQLRVVLVLELHSLKAAESKIRFG